MKRHDAARRVHTQHGAGAHAAGSAAPRGLDARRRLVGPRPHGALTLCVPLALCCVSNTSCSVHVSCLAAKTKRHCMQPGGGPTVADVSA
eukprot:scaffold102669_cov64-Phaeocystis_antarctica.AAC.4